MELLPDPPMIQDLMYLGYPRDIYERLYEMDEEDENILEEEEDV